MNTKLLEKIEEPHLKNVPDVKAGDLVRVHQKIKEGKKERVQVFEGVILRVRGGGIKKSIIVRKISFGVGVEKSFPVHAPNIEKIEVKKRAKVRRAYLTYLRNLTGKKARLRDKQFDSLVVNVQPEPEIEEESVKKDDNKIDGELTELDVDKVAAGSVEEVPLEEVEKEEIKKAEAEDEIKEGLDEDDHQKTEIEETEKGIEEAEKDIEKGKDKENSNSEKVREDLLPEEDSD